MPRSETAGGVNIRITARDKQFRDATRNVARDLREQRRILREQRRAWRQVDQAALGALRTMSSFRTAAAGGAAVSGFVLAAKRIADMNAEMVRFSDLTGQSIAVVQRFSQIASVLGSDQKAVSDAVLDVSESLTEARINLGSYAEAWERLGVAYEQVSRLAPTAQLRAIGRATSALPRDVVLQGLRQAGINEQESLNLVIRYREIERAIRDWRVATEDTIKATEEMRLEFLAVGNDLKVGFQEAVAAVSPVLRDMARDIREGIPAAMTYIIGGAQAFAENIREIGRTLLTVAGIGLLVRGGRQASQLYGSGSAIFAGARAGRAATAGAVAGVGAGGRVLAGAARVGGAAATGGLFGGPWGAAISAVAALGSEVLIATQAIKLLGETTANAADAEEDIATYRKFTELPTLARVRGEQERLYAQIRERTAELRRESRTVFAGVSSTERFQELVAEDPELQRLTADYRIAVEVAGRRIEGAGDSAQGLGDSMDLLTAEMRGLITDISEIRTPPVPAGGGGGTRTGPLPRFGPFLGVRPGFGPQTPSASAYADLTGQFDTIRYRTTAGGVGAQVVAAYEAQAGVVEEVNEGMGRTANDLDVMQTAITGLSSATSLLAATMASGSEDVESGFASLLRGLTAIQAVAGIIQTIRNIQGRADGGELRPGVPYLFGENGPEIGVFGRPGQMFSNEASGKMLGGNYFTINTLDAAGVEGVMRRFIPGIIETTRAEVIRDVGRASALRTGVRRA